MEVSGAEGDASLELAFFADFMGLSLGVPAVGVGSLGSAGRSRGLSLSVPSVCTYLNQALQRLLRGTVCIFGNKNDIEEYPQMFPPFPVQCDGGRISCL